MVTALETYAILFIVLAGVGFATPVLWSKLVARELGGIGSEWIGRIQFILAQQAYGGKSGASILITTTDGEYAIRPANYVVRDGVRGIAFDYQNTEYFDHRVDRLESLGLAPFGVFWIPHEFELDDITVDHVTVVDSRDLEAAEPEAKIELAEQSGGQDLWAPKATVEAAPTVTDDPSGIDVAIPSEDASEPATDGGQPVAALDGDAEEIVIDMARYCSEGPNSGEGDIVEHPEREGIRRSGPSRLRPIAFYLVVVFLVVLGTVMGVLFA